MTGGTITLVLAAALLHATWNALLKSGGDRLRSIVVMTAAASLAALPALVVLPGLPSQVWSLVALSCALHIGYNLLLVGAYAQGDLGQVYPVARGSSPLLVTLGAAAVIGERPGVPALLGIALVSAGIVSLARGWGGASKRGLLTAFATGGFIAAYTVVDGLAGRVSGQPISYAAWLFAVDGVVMVAVFLGWRGWRAPLLSADAEAGKSAIGGIVSVLAYGIVIWAASIAPMGAVSALRETSVVYAALIGRMFLRERLSPQRLGSCILVAAGALVLGQHA